MVRATPELFLAAACRIVSQKTPDIEHAARRLVQASGKHGIDLSLVWATVEPLHVKPLRRKVRQAALAVLGKGKTAMMFVSEPPPEGDSDGLTIGNIERAACIRAACDYFGSEVVTSETADEANSARRSPTEGLDIRIAQALPDPAEPWAVEAFQGAGFISAGTLLYLRAGASNFLANKNRWHGARASIGQPFVAAGGSLSAYFGESDAGNNSGNTGDANTARLTRPSSSSRDTTTMAAALVVGLCDQPSRNPVGISPDLRQIAPHPVLRLDRLDTGIIHPNAFFIHLFCK